MWSKEFIKTRLVKIALCPQVFGVAIGIKSHEGHYFYDDWAGYWKLGFHVAIIDVQFKLFKTKELRRAKRKLAK